MRFEQINRRCGFTIIRAKEPLLLNALEGFAHGLPHLPPIPLCQAWYQGSRGFGGMYLTLVARKVFNIHRYPGFGERIMSPLSPNYFRIKDLSETFFSKLREKDFEMRCLELKRLYEHTQQVLESYTDCIVKEFRIKIENRSVLLFRGLRQEYAQKIAFLREKAVRQHEDRFVIQTDTLSSYSSTPGYTDDAGILIKRMVPLKDVLIWSEAVALSAYKEDLHSPEEEWIVLNRHPRGELELKVEEVQVSGYDGDRLVNDMAKDYYIWEKRHEDNYVPFEKMTVYTVKNGPIVSFCKKIEMLLKKIKGK